MRRNDASFWELVLFDWTSEYGSNPTRALLLVVVLLVPCTLFYLGSLYTGSESGLYLLTAAQKVTTGKEPVSVSQLQYGQGGPRRRLSGALGYAFFFSLMSTFNIGFRQWNFGRWIRLVMPKEFDIKAHGWPRVVSGLQSLLSVGLLALALLSYFGDPFG